MGSRIELVTPLHKRTQRDYLARMAAEPPFDKPTCMEVARQYGFDYWDGDRRYGYGGYRYIPGYWKPVAEQLIARYGLTNESRILDVGCGKAHLLYELHCLLPDAAVVGFDVSAHGLANTPFGEPRGSAWRLWVGAAEDPESYAGCPDKSYDLVLAMGSLHNLKNWERAIALREIERVGKQKYLWVESYRNAQEQFNLQCWALTCWAFLTDEEWIWELQQHGYTGDYEFVYFT